MTSEKDIEIENEAKTTKNVRKQRKEIYIIIIIKKRRKTEMIKDSRNFPSSFTSIFQNY